MIPTPTAAVDTARDIASLGVAGLLALALIIVVFAFIRRIIITKGERDDAVAAEKAAAVAVIAEVRARAERAEEREEEATQLAKDAVVKMDRLSDAVQILADNRRLPKVRAG
jgi:D-arabinose 1-dehydrogenase-like Zn-dependent alcohol dehydrogenase